MGLKKCFEKRPFVVATFVMIHVGMYTKMYLSFEKFSIVFESCFESVVECGFKK